MATLGPTGLPASGNSASSLSNFIISSGPYTMSESGTATKISVACTNTSGGALGLRTAVYNDNGSGTAPDSLVAVSAEASIPNGTSHAFVDVPITASLVNGSSYWLDFWVSSNSFVFYFNTSGGVYYRSGVTYSSAGSPPDPFGSGTSAANAYGIFLTYTPSSASAWDKVIAQNFTPQFDVVEYGSRFYSGYGNAPSDWTISPDTGTVFPRIITPYYY